MTIRAYQYTVQVLVTASGFNFTVVQDLGLTQEATDGVRRNVTQDLGLNDGVAFLQFAGNGDSIEQELNLTHEAKAFGYETVESELSLTQTATREIFGTKSVPSALNLTSTAEYGFAIKNVSPENELGLTQSAIITFTPNVTSHLNLSSIAFRAWTPSNDLNLTQTVSAGKGYDVESDLDLTQSVLLNKVLNQNISHTDVVSQACTYFIESSCNRYNFNRFHGTGGVEPATKRLSYSNTFYLQSIDDGTIVQLRNPEMDDRQRYSFNRVNRNFFDGSPDIYSDDDWATEQSQIYTIVANKRSELESLYTFLQDNIGREIIIKDWKGTTWVVVVINPGDLYTEDSEGYWTLNFDVEGEALDGEWFFNYLNLTPSVSRAGSIYNRSASHGTVVSDLVGRAYDVDGDPTDLSESNIVSQEVSYVIE